MEMKWVPQRELQTKSQHKFMRPNSQTSSTTHCLPEDGAADEGLEDGSAVGVVDGMEVGILEGSCVGDELGDEDGLCDGTTDGAARKETAQVRGNTTTCI